ncbi:MAG TPA: Hpt domain-containing protein [Nitrospiraceae bacterium]|nr:Hpt domain-containing protein [Nitrospiraceae bacterium]
MSDSGRSDDVPIRISLSPPAVSHPSIPSLPKQALHHEDPPISIRVDPEIAVLIPGFLANRHKDIVSLLAAVDQGDFETARILGHSMKGSGGGYGFDGITDIGAEIETAAGRNDSVAIRSQVKALSRYLARVEVVSDGLPPI